MNTELFNRVLAHIKAHPEEWDQGSYRKPESDCGSACCLAGHAVLLAGTPTSSGDRSGAVPDRYHLRYWHTDIGRRHNELPCLGGACDGADDGGKCARHQRTGEVISRLIRLRIRARERLNQDRAIKTRLEGHYRKLPCHPDDYPCDRDGHVCFRHAETEQYVRQAFARFQRIRERGL